MINIREYEEKDKEIIIKLVGDIFLEIFNVEASNIGDLKNIKEEMNIILPIIIFVYLKSRPKDQINYVFYT